MHVLPDTTASDSARPMLAAPDRSSRIPHPAHAGPSSRRSSRGRHEFLLHAPTNPHPRPARAFRHEFLFRSSKPLRAHPAGTPHETPNAHRCRNPPHQFSLAPPSDASKANPDPRGNLRRNAPPASSPHPAGLERDPHHRRESPFPAAQYTDKFPAPPQRIHIPPAAHKIATVAASAEIYPNSTTHRDTHRRP